MQRQRFLQGSCRIWRRWRAATKSHHGGNRVPRFVRVEAPLGLYGAGARPRNPTMAAIAFRDSPASKRRLACMALARGHEIPPWRQSRSAIRPRRSAAWPGGMRLRQRRLSASGLPACRHVGTRKAAFGGTRKVMLANQATGFCGPSAAHERSCWQTKPRGSVGLRRHTKGTKRGRPHSGLL